MEFLHQCGQSQGRNVVFPYQLGELPPFWTWIRISLALTMWWKDKIDQDTTHMSMPPTLEARSYCSIYVFGNHNCVVNVDEHLTSYYGIITTFEQVISRPNDQKLIVANLQYLGWVEKFLELNYGILNIVMLLCNWVKKNCNENNVTIKWDEYDFTFVNFRSLIPIFPLHIKQVFFF